VTQRPVVSAIVVSHCTRDLTLDAVKSLVEFLPSSSEVWVVDNASPDGSADAVRERYPKVHVIELEENVGFGRANNVAMSRARGEFLLLLNSDARLREATSVPRMIDRMRENPRLGVVGPRLENDAGRLEYSARSFPSLPKEIVRRWGVYLLLPRAAVGRWLLGDFWAPTAPRVVDWVTGACMLVRHEAYERTGGFDDRIFMYGEELEWAWRLNRDDWTVVYEPGVSVVHQRAASGPTGSWRVRSALEGELRVFRWIRGRGRALGLNIIRLSGFMLEALALSVALRRKPSEYLRLRREQAWVSLQEQARLAARRPCG
jgi:GT2 family glycosyltransferase